MSQRPVGFYKKGGKTRPITRRKPPGRRNVVRIRTYTFFLVKDANTKKREHIDEIEVRSTSLEEAYQIAHEYFIKGHGTIRDCAIEEHLNWE